MKNQKEKKLKRVSNSVIINKESLSEITIEGLISKIKNEDNAEIIVNPYLDKEGFIELTVSYLK